jgi:hypothetical protein
VTAARHNASLPDTRLSSLVAYRPSMNTLAILACFALTACGDDSIQPNPVPEDPGDDAGGDVQIDGTSDAPTGDTGHDSSQDAKAHG